MPAGGGSGGRAVISSVYLLAKLSLLHEEHELRMPWR